MSKRRKVWIYLMPVFLILALNFLGLSYAQWQENAELVNSVSTGNINPVFLDSFNLIEETGQGNLTIFFEDQQTMVIQGKVEPNYAATLIYGLTNEGSIPAQMVEVNQAVAEGIDLQLADVPEALDLKNADLQQLSSPQLRIQTGEAGMYDFELELLYEPWLK